MNSTNLIENIEFKSIFVSPIGSKPVHQNCIVDETMDQIGQFSNILKAKLFL